MEENKKSIFLPISILIGAVLISGALIYNAGVKSIIGGEKNNNVEQQSGNPDAMAEVTSADYVRGNRNAPVKLVVFNDLECPFCKQFHSTLNQVSQEYKDRVVLVYRHFPLDIHPKAMKEAEAAECVGELGGNDKFWLFIDKIFEVTPSNDGLQDSQLPQIAKDIGLDASAFSSCLDSGRYAEKVAKAREEALRAGAQGTPYSVVIDKKGRQYPINGALPYADVKAVIEQAFK